HSFRAAVAPGKMRETSVSMIPRESIAPIGATKQARMKTNSGSTSTAARHCSRRWLRRSARRRLTASVGPGAATAAWAAAAAPRSIACLLGGDPGVEALVQLVQVLQPELVVDEQRRGSVLRGGREVRQHLLVDQRRRGLGRHAVRNLRRQV